MRSSAFTKKYINDISPSKKSEIAALVDLLTNKDIQAIFEKIPTNKESSSASSHHRQPKAVENLALSHAALVKLPKRIIAALDAATEKSHFPEILARDIFQYLEKNTEKLKELWVAIKPPPQYLWMSGSEEKARQAVVLHRFNDVPLIENGAVEDLLRSEQYGIKHFLHANLMVFPEGMQFIASQRPYKTIIQDEIPGFWHMVHQRKVPVIVDLTKPDDHKNEVDYSFGKERNHGTKQCGPLNIGLPENKVLGKMRSFPARVSGQVPPAEKIFSISHGGVSHEVKRIHFKDWPDHGVISPVTLIALADQIEAASKGSNAPVLIHCRAGVGRTGTLISFIVARKLIARELEQGNGPVTATMIGKVLLDVTATGRLGRGPQFVQREEQFHSAANALALCFSTRNQASPQTSASGSKAGQLRDDNIRRTLQSARLGVEIEAVKDIPLMSNPEGENEGENTGSVKRSDKRVDGDRPSAGVDIRRPTSQTPPSKNLSALPAIEPAAISGETVADAVLNRVADDVIKPNTTDQSAADIAPASHVTANTDAADLKASVGDASAPNEVCPEVVQSETVRPTGLLPNVAIYSAAYPGVVNTDNFPLEINNARKANANIKNSAEPINHPHRVSNPVARLWQALSTAVTEPIVYLDDDTIEQKVTRLPCVAATAVSVIMSDERKYIHANHVHISQFLTDVHAAPTANRYIAGQSPKHFTACEKILLKAIDSREGIFQIVTPETHKRLHDDRLEAAEKLSVAPILMQILAKHARGEEITLDNRYRLIPKKRESTADHIASYDLTIRSLAGDDEFTIPITQIGLKFDNAVLKEEDIRAANQSLAEHLQSNIAANNKNTTEPIILSRKGVGRNATLIAYHEISKSIRSGHITSDADLDAALLRTITEGRKARSIHFVHSAPQLEELRNALLTQMATQQSTEVVG